MPITSSLSKEDLEKACKTLVIQQTNEGEYLVQVPIIGVHKSSNFEGLINFLRGYYEDGKSSSSLKIK